MSDQPKPRKQDALMLLPCPFCGSENVGVEPLTGGFVVDCKDCGGGCGTCHDEQAAREEWNKRKSLREILKEHGLDSDRVTSEITAKVEDVIKQRKQDAATPATGELSPDRMVKYPFPIRDGICCHFEVPRDLTQAEVKRIASYLGSLTSDQPKPRKQDATPTTEPRESGCTCDIDTVCAVHGGPPPKPASGKQETWDEIVTRYNNEANPSEFAKLGEEQVAPVTHEPWTADFICHLPYFEISEIHNASIAAERKDHTERMNSVQDFYSRKLAAERETHKDTQERANEHAEQCGKAQHEIQQLREQESEALCLKDREVIQLRQQLAAAQARLLDLIKMCNDHDIYPDTKIDTTILDEYVAKHTEQAVAELKRQYRDQMQKECQPLVEALTRIADGEGMPSGTLQSIAEHALAKVKEGG